MLRAHRNGGVLRGELDRPFCLIGRSRAGVVLADVLGVDPLRIIFEQPLHKGRKPTAVLEVFNGGTLEPPLQLFVVPFDLVPLI